MYERFYDRLSEAEKAEARAAFHLASSGARLLEDQDFAAAYRWVLNCMQEMGSATYGAYICVVHAIFTDGACLV